MLITKPIIKGFTDETCLLPIIIELVKTDEGVTCCYTSVVNTSWCLKFCKNGGQVTNCSCTLFYENYILRLNSTYHKVVHVIALENINSSLLAQIRFEGCLPICQPVEGHEK